jgi:hypothetical protein
MSRTPHGANYFRGKLDRIAAESDALIARVETEPATERDVAISAELVQRYLDTLDEILDSDLHAEMGVTVGIDGEVVRFQSVDQMADFIVEVMK